MRTAGIFLFLGSGASMGIPVIGCKCAVCISESPCNHRLRPSGLLTVGGRKFLFDCGPDFRLQAIQHKIDRLDGILLTHAHHDHTAGLDEVRVYYMREKKAIPCLLSPSTAADIQMRYPYIFGEPGHAHKLIPRMALQELKDVQGEVVFEKLRIQYVTYEQGGMPVNGFRLGNFAYISDIRHYPESLFEALSGVEVLVLSALRMEPTPFHFSIDEAVAFSERVGAAHTWLTHIAHELDHEATNARLPPNVRMAYDGLELDVLIDEVL